MPDRDDSADAFARALARAGAVLFSHWKPCVRCGAAPRLVTPFDDPTLDEYTVRIGHRCRCNAVR